MKNLLWDKVSQTAEDKLTRFLVDVALTCDTAPVTAALLKYTIKWTHCICNVD